MTAQPATQVLDASEGAPDAELTTEANPESVDPAMLQWLNGDENDQGKAWRFDSKQVRTERASLYRFQ